MVRDIKHHPQTYLKHNQEWMQNMILTTHSTKKSTIKPKNQSQK
jgi:hypothetical protein